MFKNVFCLLLIVIFCESFSQGENFVIDISNNNKSDLIFTKEFAASLKSYSSITLSGLDQASVSYAVLQVHSYYFNVTLSLEKNLSKSSHQNGTNLGFVLSSGTRSKTVHLFNDNYDDVQCLVAVVIYNHSAPIVGGCNLNSAKYPGLQIEEKGYFIELFTPEASASLPSQFNDSGKCTQSSELKYKTYYTYLKPLNFDHEIYFDGIKKLLFTYTSRSVHQAKQAYSQQELYFEKIPGTGIVFNTIVVDQSGQKAFYVPSVTYSCPENTWNAHCFDTNISKRAICVLLVLYSVTMMANVEMPDLIEATLNGLLVGSFLTLATITHRQLTISNFDVFMTTIFGGLMSSVAFGTVSLYLRIGRYLTKLILSNLLMAIVMEVFVENVTSIYIQFGSAFIISLCLHCIRMSFSVYLGGLLLIMSLSYLLKTGNIHRVLVNNFYALTSPYPGEMFEESVWNLLRHNFINYKMNLNFLDWFFIMFYLIGATALTLRKEIYLHENPSSNASNDDDNIDQFNRGVAKNRCQKCLVGIKSNGRLRLVSRCRRHHYRSNVIHERSPLISHWIETDESEDEVFESPNSNLRFLQTLSADSRERLDAIQNFPE